MKTKWVLIPVIFVSAIPFCFFTFICRYLHLQNDDFSIFPWGENEGPILGTYYAFLFANARVVANFVNLSLPKAADFLTLSHTQFSRLWTVFLLLTLLLCFYKYIRNTLLFKSKAQTLYLTFVLSSSLLLSMPFHFDFIYYQAGSSNYFVPFLLFLLFLGQGRQQSVWLKALLALLVVWTHELMAVYFACYVFFAFVFKQYEKTELRAFCLVSLAGLLLPIVAPSTWIRVEAHSQMGSGQLWPSIIEGGSYGLSAVPVLDFAVLLMLTIVIMTSCTSKAQRNPALLIAGLMTLPLFGIVKFLGMGDAGGGRVWTLSFCLYFLSIMQLGIIVGGKLRFLGKISPALAFCLSLVLILHPSTNELQKEFLVKGPQFDRQMRNRYARLHQAKAEGKNEVSVPSITGRTKFLAHPVDILKPGSKGETDYYGQKVYRQYFKIQQIVAY